ALGAFRHPRLDRPPEARPPQGRRGQRHPRDVRGHRRALRQVNTPYDRRITAARPDLAAAHLKGVIEAERYREGRIKQVSHSFLGLRAAPDSGAMLGTQLLFGEVFTVYELKNGWVWGQAALDSYVGYAPADAFRDSVLVPTHRVTAIATPLLLAPDPKQP